MEIIDGWKHKELFFKNNAECEFGIEIAHWRNGLGINRWNVYVVIREANPLFELLDTGSSQSFDLEDEIGEHFHWGLSYKMKGYHTQLHRAGGFRKLGSDYNHLDDEKFGSFDNLEEASEVLEDARKLWDFMVKKTEELGINNNG